MNKINLKKSIIALLLSGIMVFSSFWHVKPIKVESNSVKTENAYVETTIENANTLQENTNANILQQGIADEQGVVDHVKEQINTTDAMPQIESSLGGYRLGGVQTLSNDGHIGIAVELSVYYKSTNKVVAGPNGTPIILYTVNTYTVRTGTKSDVEIITSMLNRGYVVVVLNYKFNTRAVSPALDWSAQSVRNKMMNGEFFKNLSLFDIGVVYYETFIVPSGYDVSLNHVYWEFDKHGADGTFDKIVEVWNNDFRKGKAETLIKWTNSNGIKKSVQNDFDGNKPVWCNVDGSTNANGEYIKIKFTKAQSITDCVKADGSPIDLNLYMHIIYPTNPKTAVPVMALNSSSEHLAKGSSVLGRPQVPGFAFNGYASVMFDFGYTPMARDDHYGFFQHAISGDSLSYAVHFYSDKKIGTAAMRYIRYLSLTDSTYKFDNNSIGVYGNSKGGWITYLGEEHPELLTEERIALGHHGETRYDNGDTTTIGVIDGGEKQPWLTYNGQVIDSGADFIYASCGGLEENITYGHAPTYVSCNTGDVSYYSSSNAFVNLCRVYDIPCLWFENSKGHTLASGVDLKYGIDTYPALYDFANFYLKKSPVKLLYTDLVNGASEVGLTQSIFFMFSGGVGLNQIKKLTPTTQNGTMAEGEWTSCYGGTWWTFTPKLYKSNEYYSVNIPKSFYGENKVRIEQAQSFYFMTKHVELTEDEFVKTNNGVYTWFTVGEGQEYILRAYVSDNATNKLALYQITNFNTTNPDSSTKGELLQEKVVYKSGNVEFDISNYCKSYAKGTKLYFLLKQTKQASQTKGISIGFDNNDKGGISIAGKIAYELTNAPDGSSALKITEMQPNSNYNEQEFYNNITTIAVRYYALKCGTSNKLTSADIGRRFKISFRVYDTFSRTMQAFLKSPTSSADGISDYNWTIQNFYTKANKWVNVELEYIVYEPYLYTNKEFDVPSLAFKACALGNIDSPFYIDSITTTEIVDNIDIQSISVQGAKAKVDTSNIPTSQSIASATINSISQKSHPYILYENSEIDQLKQKINNGYSKKAYDYIAQKVKSYKNATINVYYNSSSDKSNGIIGRQLQSYVAYLNTYGIISGDNQYRQKALDLVMSAVNSGSVDIYYGINGALCVADFGYAYALAYDWLYDMASTSQKTALKAEMEEIGAWIYNLSINPTESEPWGSSDQNRKAWNWNAVTHGSLAVISLSLGIDNAKTDWLSRAIDRIKDYYTFAVDTQGCAFEGLHYIGYALNTLTVVDDTIYNLTGIELLDYYSHFYNLTNWSMRMTAPYGNEQASIGQGSKLDNYATTFYLINKKHQRLELWGWERTYNLQNGGKITDDYAGNGFNAPNLIFFEDKSLTPLAPNENTPLITTYDKGMVLARDGWQENDSMMTFFSGWGYQGCWNHPDNNTFTFFANGESFVIDLGANYKTSQEHNIVQVDGTGFYYTAPSMIVGTISINKNLSNGALYLKGDNSDCYRDTVLTESTRQMIYMGGQTPYIIAFDYVYAGTSSHTYTTNFFTDFSSTVTTNGNKAKIVGGNGGAEAFVYAFSTDNASVSTNKTDKTLALVTTNKAVTHKQATVFITKMPNGQEPIVVKKVVNGNLQISVSYINDNTEITDSYTFYSNKEVEVSTTKHTHTLTRVQGTSPTCTSGGILEHYLCSGCNRKFADSNATTIIENTQISATGHSAVFVQEKQGNCKENGYIAHYYCENCNSYYLDKECVNKVEKVQTGLGEHNYGEWIKQVESTCNNSGIKGHYHCSICSKNFDINKVEVVSLIITANGHTFTKQDANSKYLKEEATCSQKAKYFTSCQDCGLSSKGQAQESTFTYGEFAEHSYGEWIKQVEPTHNSYGTKGHYSCCVCNKNFDTNHNEILDLKIEKLPSSSSSNFFSSSQISSTLSSQQSSCESSLNQSSNSIVSSNKQNERVSCNGSIYGASWLVIFALIGLVIIKRKTRKTI